MKTKKGYTSGQVASILETSANQMRDIAANTETDEKVAEGWKRAADWLEKSAEHYRLTEKAW